MEDDSGNRRFYRKKMRISYIGCSYMLILGILFQNEMNNSDRGDANKNS